MKARGRFIHYLRVHGSDAVVGTALEEPAASFQCIVVAVCIPKESKVNSQEPCSLQLQLGVGRGDTIF
jgi:hypothetical protein